MQGDFTLQIQSKSDTFSTSKLLSVSEDVQLLCHNFHDLLDFAVAQDLHVHVVNTSSRRERHDVGVGNGVAEPTRILDKFGSKMDTFRAPFA